MPRVQIIISLKQSININRFYLSLANLNITAYEQQVMCQCANKTHDFGQFTKKTVGRASICVLGTNDQYMHVYVYLLYWFEL